MLAEWEAGGQGQILFGKGKITSSVLYIFGFEIKKKEKIIQVDIVHQTAEEPRALVKRLRQEIWES